MWQIDIKEPFLLNGERVNSFLILEITPGLLSVQLFESITTDIVAQKLNLCMAKYCQQNKIPADIGPQFREGFKN